MRFALNHSLARGRSIPQFLDLTNDVGVDAVELRAIMPPGLNVPEGSNVLNYSAAEIAALSQDAGIAIVSINAWLRLDLWNDERAEQARVLVGFAETAGIPAIVLCPQVSSPGSGPVVSQLELALDVLQPMLDSSGVRGVIEPLGFTRSSIRFKAFPDRALQARGMPRTFAIVHDSFHHAMAGERMYPPNTALAHLSGVLLMSQM
jgi:2-keto-myo-inositol isomerase